MGGLPEQVLQKDRDAQEAIKALEQSTGESTTQSVIEPVIPQTQEVAKDLQAELDKKTHSFDVERGRLKKRIEELEGNVATKDSDLEAKLLLAQKEAEEAKARLDEIEVNKEQQDLFSNEEREDLGSEYVDMATKISNDTEERLTKKFEAREKVLTDLIEDLKGKTDQSSEAVFGQQVLSKLGMSSDEFATMDNDPLFNKWLENKDGFSGRTVGASLDNAFDSGDSDAVVSIVKAYKNQNQQKVSNSVELPKQVNNINVGVQQTPPSTDYTTIATQFANGEINREQMISLTDQLDNQLRQEIG